MNNPLAKIDAIRTAIAQAKTLNEVRNIRDKAEAIRVYVKAAGYGLDIQNDAAEAKIHAERKAGEMLAEQGPKRGGDRKSKSKGHDVTLKDIGVTNKQSERWQAEASVPEEVFQAHVAEVREKGGEVTSAGVIQLAKRKEKRDAVRIEPPKGKYAVIYADPPWDIGSMVLDKWDSPIEEKYPTMTLDELKGLKIEDLSADDCVCFMWTTLSTLPIGLELLSDWGFKYHITLTWDKGGGWSSNGFHRRTELVLVGYKGRISQVVKQEGEYIPTIFSEKKTKHSAKPSIMRRYIEDRTVGPKIELFARGKAEKGWVVWGNQAEA